MDREGRGILLTGATGFLGGEILARLLEREQGTVYALVRAADDEQARLRLEAVVASLLGSPGRWADRLVAVAGDLTAGGLGLGAARRRWLAERVDRIIHCAASVSFTLDLERSRAINLDGTRRVLELGQACERCGGLSYLIHVSTAFVAGEHPGSFSEGDLDVGQGFRNGYERSKFEAEQLVRQFAGELPVQVVRPSIVVGDSRTGWTSSFNVVYGPLRAYSAGALAVVPARRPSPVDVVPVDYVADAILALAGRPGTTHHVTAGDRANSVGELIELAASYTGRRPPRVVPPGLYRRAVHPLLVRRGSERRRRVLRASEALFPYFAMQGRFDDAGTRAALAAHGLELPPLAGYFDRLMAFAETARWGRELPPRHRVFPAAAEPATLARPRAA